MDVQVNKNTFKELLLWSLSSASIADKQFSEKIDEFHKSLVSEEVLNNKIADYIFDTYEKVIVTSDEKVYGIKSEIRSLLFDAEGSKVYSEVTTK